MVLPSQKGQSPLVLACVGGHTETVKVLLESKLAQVDLQNDVRWENISRVSYRIFWLKGECQTKNGRVVDLEGGRGNVMEYTCIL